MPPFIARGDELPRIAAAWDRLATGGGPVAAVLTGEAGLGKTSMLREAVRMIDPPRLLVGTARAEGAAPHDWFAAATAAVDRPEGVDERLWRVLRQEPLASPIPLPDGALLRGAVQALRRIIGPGPALLAVDDLHWLDLESLALWSELAAAWDLPVMLLACSRDPGEARHPRAAARTLARLSSIGARLPLRPFTSAETLTLVSAATGGPISRAAARTIHRRTGGNPFWVTELAVSGAKADTPLPGHLGALVRARLAGEDQDVWQVARDLALLGERIATGTATDLLGAPFRRHLPRLVAAGVLCHDHATVRFPHALIREAFAATALPHEAEALHLAALESARARGDDASIAMHALAIGAIDEAVGAAGRTARRQLANWLTESAQETAESALRSAPDHPDLLDTAGQAALVNGDFDSAQAHLERLTTIASDNAVRCAARLRLAEIAWHQGRIAHQWDCLDRADALAAPGSAEHARCLVARAMALVRNEDFGPIPGLCDEADPLLAHHGLTAERRSAAISRAMAVHRLGDPDSAADALRQVWREAEADGDLRWLCRAVNNLLVIEMPRLPGPQAWQCFEAGVRAVGDLGMAAWGGKIYRVAADFAIESGDLDRAWNLLSTRAADEPDPHERAVLAAKSGLLAVERDDRAAAVHYRREAFALIPGMDQAWVITYAHWLATAVAARFGDRSDVQTAMRAYRDAVPPDLHRRRTPRVLEVALLAVESGIDADAVQRFLARSLGTVPGPGSSPPAALMWMSIRAANGDWNGVVALLDGALNSGALNSGALNHDALDDGARKVGAHDDRRALDDTTNFPLPPTRRSTAHSLASQAYRQLGDIRAAIDHAERAAALLRHWPGWRSEQAQAHLTAIRPHVENPCQRLTARETEVLESAASGRTNRQIATALNISQRTVEVHMSRILAKTGTASRTEAVARYLRR
ncbi:LuxR C-terminal-related transcriptional regulator [Glycomyces sp. NPDC049804]|uniref:helix-turn-helix transcriptional regulator n=1 Tax=Glycomyces sp. NPDC049804 TaxID=3154363 RepID=UPI0034141763